MRKSLMVVAVAAIAVVAATLVLLRESAPNAVADAPGSDPALPAPDAGITAAGTTVPERAADAWREAAGAPAAAARRATITGRCLAAEDGAPLADCSLRFTFLARATTQGPGAEPPRHPDAEGRFRLEVVPLHPEPGALSIDHGHRASLRFTWGAVAAGQVVDLGDLRLAHGVQVQGRAVDTEGEPWPDLQLRLARTDGQGQDRGQVVDAQAQSGGDGRFTFGVRVQPGAWQIHTLPPRALTGDVDFQLAAHETVRDVQLVLPADAPEDVITGVALDQAGAPAAGVGIEGSPRIQPARTDSQGRFRLRRGQGGPRVPVRLSIMTSREFELLQQPEAVTWGTRDLRLVLRRLLGVEVQVLDADQRPVEAFRLQCFAHPNKRSSLSFDNRDPIDVTGARDGVAFVRAVRTGANVLKVVPHDRERQPLGAFAEFTMTERGAPRQIVRLPRAARRAAVVVFGDGTPVPATTLELVEAIAPRLRLPAPVDDLAKLFEGVGAGDGLCWCRTTTDANGEAALLGPAGKSFALQVRSERHLTKVVEAVSLDVAEPLRIVIARGAELRGKVGPAATLDHLRAPLPLVAGTWPPGAIQKRPEAVTLFLQDPADPRRMHPESMPVRFGAPIADDGSFALAGIPPGTWDVKLLVMPMTGMPVTEVLARVADLRDGEIRTVELDVAFLTTTGLKGQVVCDGVPLANARVDLFGEPADKRGDVRHQTSVTTDADGRFDLQLPAWLYGVWVHHPRGGPLPLPCGEGALVERGRTTERLFEARALRVVLRILDADGAPVAGRDLKLSLLPFEGDVRTDAQGRVTIDPAPSFPFRVRAWPAYLNDPVARTAAQKQSKTDPKNQMIDLGLVTLPADRNDVTLDLRLPR